MGTCTGTIEGGANCIANGGCGTVFKITPSGTLTTLYNFCSQGGSNCTDGAYPNAGLVQDTIGKFYGTTAYGGSSNACSGGCGTIFTLSVGLGPFVETAYVRQGWRGRQDPGDQSDRRDERQL